MERITQMQIRTISISKIESFFNLQRKVIAIDPIQPRKPNDVSLVFIMKCSNEV